MSRREQLLFSTADSSLRRAFRSGRGATPAYVLKRSPVLIGRKTVIGCWATESTWRADHSDDRGWEILQERPPTLHWRNLHLDLGPIAVRRSCSPDTDAAVFSVPMLGDLLFWLAPAGDRSLAQDRLRRTTLIPSQPFHISSNYTISRVGLCTCLCRAGEYVLGGCSGFGKSQ